VNSCARPSCKRARRSFLTGSPCPLTPGGGVEPWRAGVALTHASFRERYSHAMIERGSGSVGAFCWIPLHGPPKGRRCRRCREVLPFSAFRPNLRLSSGWSSWCRACSGEATRQWRREHPESNERRRIPPSKLRCVECGGEFEGRKGKLICSRRCKDRRYARLHPEELREKQRRRYARRKAA
jgi:hypothetical protein